MPSPYIDEVFENQIRDLITGDILVASTTPLVAQFINWLKSKAMGHVVDLQDYAANMDGVNDDDDGIYDALTKCGTKLGSHLVLTPTESGLGYGANVTNVSRLIPNGIDIWCLGYAARINRVGSYDWSATNRLFSNVDNVNGGHDIRTHNLIIDGNEQDVVVPSSHVVSTHLASAPYTITVGAGEGAAFSTALAGITDLPARIVASDEATYKERLNIVSIAGDVITVDAAPQNTVGAGDLISFEKSNTSDIFALDFRGGDPADDSTFLDDVHLYNTKIVNWPGGCIRGNTCRKSSDKGTRLINCWRGGRILQDGTEDWKTDDFLAIDVQDDNLAENSSSGFPVKNCSASGVRIERANDWDHMGNSLISLRGSLGASYDCEYLQGGHDACISIEDAGDHTTQADEVTVHAQTIRADGYLCSAVRCQSGSGQGRVTVTVDHVPTAVKSGLDFSVDGDVGKFVCHINGENLGSEDITDVKADTLGHNPGINLRSVGGAAGSADAGFEIYASLTDCYGIPLDTNNSNTDIREALYELFVRNPNTAALAGPPDAVNIRNNLRSIVKLIYRDAAAACGRPLNIDSGCTDLSIVEFDVPMDHFSGRPINNGGTTTRWRAPALVGTAAQKPAASTLPPGTVYFSYDAGTYSHVNAAGAWKTFTVT